jgi:hypothetical protein
MIGDFNAHSPKWGYKDTNAPGKEMEDLLNTSILDLIYDDTDPSAFMAASLIVLKFASQEE